MPKSDVSKFIEFLITIAESSNDFNPANLSNPSSLQLTNQLIAGGAGGRGEALGYIGN